MEGISSNKINRLKELISENKYILLVVFSPLLLHYSLKLLCIKGIPDLNSFLIARDIYLILLSIYLGYLFLETIRIMRLPVIKWKVIKDGAQVLLELEMYKDFFNKQLGISILDKVSNRIKLNDEITYRGKWQSMPEPLVPVIFNEALYDSIKPSIAYAPNTALIPGNKYSYIKHGENECLIMLWQKDNKLYIIDEYRYHVAFRYDSDLEVELPLSIEVELDNHNEKYTIRTTLDKDFLND